MRDCRINTIFEGSSEIMRLFIAREALDPHLKVAAPMLDSRISIAKRMQPAAKAGLFYAGWYARQWLPFGGMSTSGFHPRLARQLRSTSWTSRQLARAIFHALIRYGPALERQQVLLGRFVDIGAELFAITASCSRAQSMLNHGADEAELLALVEYFGNTSRLRIRQLFRELHHNTDRDGYKFAQGVLAGKFDWLREGILRKK